MVIARFEQFDSSDTYIALYVSVTYHVKKAEERFNEVHINFILLIVL